MPTRGSKRQPASQLVGKNDIPRALEVEDRREEELLGARVETPVAVQVDPEAVLRIGQQPVAVAVDPSRGERSHGLVVFLLVFVRRRA